MNYFNTPFEENLKYSFLVALLVSLPATLIKPEYNIFVFAASYLLWEESQKLKVFTLLTLSWLVDITWIVVNAVIYNSDEIRGRESNYYVAGILLTSIVLLGKLFMIGGMLSFSRECRGILVPGALREMVRGIKI